MSEARQLGPRFVIAMDSVWNEYRDKVQKEAKAEAEEKARRDKKRQEKIREGKKKAGKVPMRSR